MRILIGVHHFPPRYSGGAEWWTCRMAAGLASRGHEIHVVCVEATDAGSGGGLAWTDDRYAGVAVRRLTFDLRAAPDRARWEYDNPWIGAHLEELCRAWRPDAFHLVSGYLLSGRALLSARAARVPSLVTLTDLWFLCPRITMLRTDGTLSAVPLDATRCARCLGEERRRYRWPGRLAPTVMGAYWRFRADRVRTVEERARFLRDALRGADLLVVPSRAYGETFTQAGLGPARLVVCRHGVELPTGPAPARPREGGPLRVGYLGQIAWHKGVHVLLDAVRRLRRVSLSVRIHGDGTRFPEYARYLRRLATSDPRVVMAPPYRRDELSGVLGDLDVVVVPSLWHEAGPIVAMEALAHGVPVVATDLGSTPEVVRDGDNGLLFPRGDVASLARALERLAGDPGLVATLRAGATYRRTVEDELDDYERFYRRLAAGAPAA